MKRLKNFDRSDPGAADALGPPKGVVGDDKISRDLRRLADRPQHQSRGVFGRGPLRSVSHCAAPRQVAERISSS